MKKHDIIFLTGLIVLSVLTSFAFIFYGMNIIMEGTAVRGVMIFAYVTTSYGLANVAILSVAWGSRNEWSNGASKFIAMCYLAVYALETMNAGLKGPLGVVGILVLVLILFGNCYTVKKVVERG